MIAVPSVRYGFPRFAGHASRHMEWRFTGECLLRVHNACSVGKGRQSFVGQPVDDPQGPRHAGDPGVRAPANAEGTRSGCAPPHELHLP